MSTLKNKKVSVIGAGYVGMSIAVLLSQKHDVTIVDIDEKKLNLINQGKSPIKDSYIEDFMGNKDLNLRASSDIKHIENSDFIILAVPTNFIEEKNSFDTSILKKLINDILKINKTALIVIKSTIPIGWTDNINKKYPNQNIIFSPEFLREGNALYDNLYPSRIIVGSKSEAALEFGSMLKSASLKEDLEVLYTNSSEAESIKLFSNSYLAMRIAFFNEVDNFAIYNKLDAKSIISGISLDPRVGDYYNNPSFGYGGYCLPKDTKQLLSNYIGIEQSLIESIVQSNNTRLNFIADDILNLGYTKIGIYKLEMKKGSDNHRDSAITNLVEIIRAKNSDINFLIYEPSIDSDQFIDIEVINNLQKFKDKSELILCNRKPDNSDLNGKNIYSRDLYGNN